MHQNPDPYGELMTLPRLPSRLGKGIPHPFGVSNSAPRFSAPSPNIKSWIRQCCYVGLTW